jgi:hypothetical protein
MTWLAALIGVDPELLRLLAAIFSLVAAICTAITTVYGILNRRARLRAEETAEATAVLVRGLAELLRDRIPTPEDVRTIATEAATEVLTPVHRFFAAVELVESRRQHRPETDIIAILEKELAA